MNIRTSKPQIFDSINVMPVNERGIETNFK